MTALDPATRPGGPTTAAGWELHVPPGWPPPPAGWSPPTGWSPDPAWPKPPRGWHVWRPAAAAGTEQPDAQATRDLTWAEPLGAPAAEPAQRRRLRQEVLVALSVFPLPALTTALVLLVRAALEGTAPRQISNVLPEHPALSSVLGSVLYATSGSAAVLALFLLSAGGLSLRRIGLSRAGLASDARGGLGLALAGLGIAMGIAMAVYGAFGKAGAPLSVRVEHQHYPAVFLVQGFAVSTVTALVEESVMSAYLLTRLGQLGWTPRRALWVSMAIRTSYHAYYGVGLLLTVPVGYLLTRSFQRHRRLLRPVMAHAVYDASLFTLAILTS